MWSDRYNYYNIQSDRQFSKRLDTRTVVDCLLNTKLFKQTGHQTFRNKDKFPWTDIFLTETSNGSFGPSDADLKQVNLIAIVCSKGQDIDQELYINTFKKIAEKLNWTLYLGEDDEGNEDIEIA
jgi:hypothetical protein